MNMKHRLIVIVSILLVIMGCTPRIDLPAGQEQSVFPIDTPQDGSSSWVKRYRLASGDVLGLSFQLPFLAAVSGPYRFSVGDKLVIKFPQTPELNETQSIRPDGTISLPYLGEISVAGMTVRDLTGYLDENYFPILHESMPYITLVDYKADRTLLREDLKELSRHITVGPDGYVSPPLVPAIKVSGYTLAEATQELEVYYADKIPKAKVGLSLEQHSRPMIYLLGEVRKSGAHQIAKPITIIEAIAMAGGYLNSAHTENIIVVRRRQDRVVARRLNLGSAITASSAPFLLEPDDVVFVPRSPISHLADLASKISEFLLFKGWSTSLSWTANEKGFID
jgi:polysaccharide biosynthesis/export protein